MSKQNRVAGIRRIVAVGTALAVAGCGADGSLGANHGQLRLVLSRDATTASANVVTDASASYDQDGDHADALWFQSISVTLSSIYIRNTDGVLVPLDVPLPVDVDVMKIDGGKQVVLPDGLLEIGTYDQVVLVMTAVHGTTEDGTMVTIDPPGGGWTAVIPICPLEVTDGSTATVGITLNARNSFLRVGSHWQFQPRFRSRLDCPVTDAGTSGN